MTFQSNDFISACATCGAGTLVSVRFNASIDNAGKLYYGYINPGQYGGQVSPLVSFAASGSASVSSVTFVPKAGYTGTTTITYTGTDSNGGTFTGQVNITVTPAAQLRPPSPICQRLQLGGRLGGVPLQWRYHHRSTAPPPTGPL